MKRLVSLAMTAVYAASIMVFGASVGAETTNLIANASAEAAAQPEHPDGWQANKWGTNTSALSYASDGHSGQRSLRVDMTSRSDGDAKWMHNAVSVTGGITYTFSNYYKSNIVTEIDAQYFDAAGVVRYAYLGSLPASDSWTQATLSFVVPSDVVSVVVMHIIAQTGWLQTDDYSLSTTTTPAPDPVPTPEPTPTPTPTPVTGNLILNSSVETAGAQAPTNWIASRWGTNTATLTYANSGRTGTRSVQVDMTTRTNGDAKWMHDAVTVTPGTVYTYSAYYKATTDTEIDLQYTDANGVASYAYIQSVPASADWKEVVLQFTPPANAKQVVIMHILAQTGTLQTDDFSLVATNTTPTPTPTPDPTPVPTDTDSLIANSSFETANGTAPASWQHNSWGTNSTQFTYATEGHTGSRSATVTMTSVSSGDAKWFADPVTVVAGKSYLYRDYYKATTSTRVVVGFQDASGTYSYKELNAASAAADWQQYSAVFTVPNGVNKATIFHLIDTIGTLTIDDVVLAVAVPTAASTIPNGSLETSTTAQQPQNWQNATWGNNVAQYTYLNEGHTGNRSVRVSVSNYVDGDAKWFFDPVTTLVPGQQYRFSVWYKTNAVSPRVFALLVDRSGVEHYASLPSALPSGATDWQQYSDTFRVPEGTVAVSVFMMLTENAWLQTDDYSITDYQPIGFDRPLLSLTFDDGHEDNEYTALPLMEQYGFKSTQCYATSFIEGIPSAVSAVEAFYSAGHEICSHTVTHPFLTQLSGTEVDYELSHAQAVLQSVIGTAVRNFATPYGDYNEPVLTQIEQYYQSHRTVDEGFNTKDNFDIYRLRVQNILDTTSAAQVGLWVNQAQAENAWLILVYHRVAADPGPYDTYTDVFDQQLAAIQSSGIVVKTYQAALDELLPQL